MSWQERLAVAEHELSGGRPREAFLAAFGSLEICYGANVHKAMRPGQDAFGEIVRDLENRRKITKNEATQARYLSAARNVCAHTWGFEPSMAEAERSLARIRKLCGKFGRTVSEVMAKPVVTASPDEPVGRYVREMQDCGFSYFPVVDGQGRVIGTLDEWTIIEAIGEHDGIFDLEQPVREYMRDEVLPDIEPNATLEAAARRLKHAESRALLVLAAGRPTGIVTAFDLIH